MSAALESPAFTSAHPLAEITTSLVREGLDRLSSPGGLQDEETVHLLRVATKRLRAAWHLVQELAGKDLARERRASLQRLSSMLSASRDFSVLDGLLQDLAARQTDGRIALALDKVRDRMRAPGAFPPGDEENSVDSSRDAIGAILEEEVEAWHRLEEKAPDHWRRAIRHQLRKSRMRARRDARLALGSTDAELWHDWRKQVKRLRYQREFVATTQGRTPGKIDARISRLGSRLGERNDLANLVALIDRYHRDEVLSGEEYGTLRKVIAREESRLISQCRRLGRQALLRPK